MKNHKGVIATFLTLGLVIVGTLITLGTSLFVSNKKTNLASNSRAATVNCIYDTVNLCRGECRDTTICLKCRNTKYRCRGTTDDSAVPTSASTNTSTTTPYNCSDHGGGTAYQGVGCYDLCAKKGAKYISNSQGVGTDSKKYCCCGGGISGVDGYPTDDSCWLVKCLGGKADKVKYASSLKKSSMPLSSCSGGSPYSGGGWMIIGEKKASNTVKTFDCQGGNVEITKMPTPRPTIKMTLTPTPKPTIKITLTPTPKPINQGNIRELCKELKRDAGLWMGSCNGKLVCDPRTGRCIANKSGIGAACQLRLNFKCSSAGYANSTQTFNYYKSTSTTCKYTNLAGKCYGSSSNSCSTEWSAFLKSQCEMGSNTGNGTGGQVTNSCTTKSCKSLDTRYANKNYYELNGKFYEDKLCLENNRIVDTNSLALFCAKQTVGLNFLAAWDNACVQKTSNPLAYCVAPAINLPCKAGYEYSGDTCNDVKAKCCVPKATAQTCIKKNCHDINSNYTASIEVYEKNSIYYADLNDCSNGSNSINDIVMNCTQGNGIQTSVDNTCKQQTGDPKAYCNNIGPFGLNTIFTRNLPCKSGFDHASARCGFPSTVCCVQRIQQVPNDMVIPLKGDCFDKDGFTYCQIDYYL